MNRACPPRTFGSPAQRTAARLLMALLGLTSCHAGPGQNGSAETSAGAVAVAIVGGTPADSSLAGRATVEAAEVARLRAIAEGQRKLIAAYDARPALTNAKIKTDLNAPLKASATARATGADQTADRLQARVDYHLEEARKVAAR